MAKSLKPNMNQIVGTHHLLFVTLDTLRFDVAQKAFSQNQLPVISKWLPPEGWQRRHTPANFTYAAHHAFFSPLVCSKKRLSWKGWPIADMPRIASVALGSSISNRHWAKSCPTFFNKAIGMSSWA